LPGHVIKMMAEMPRLVAAGRRIENDAGAHAPDDFRRAPLVEEKALRSRAFFPRLAAMTDMSSWKILKWPFLFCDALLLGFAGFIVWKAPHPISHTEAALCISLAALGGIVGCVPFILEYRAFLKIVEVNALGAAVEQIQNLEKIAAQISSATNQWEAFHGIVQGNSDKTVAAAKGIAEKMSSEVREFSGFMQKMNDSEKAALRLEAEKARRSETEWLQTLVRILDHIFALRVAAARSAEPKVAEQIAHFQSACRGVVRRVGLAAFEAGPDEAFNPERHQVADGAKPSAGSVIGETVGAGYTFQGKLLRPALVRLREKNSSDAKPAKESTSEMSGEEKAEDQLSLRSPD
jgi:molecular chaperone GrpE (heat shock protein)